jgi:N-acetylneuraminic acid mutarotase
MLIFGGFDVATGLLDDFWSYHPESNAWTEVFPAGEQPPGRLSASMIWDPSGGQVLLYGGGCGGCYRDDLWSYRPDVDRWEKLDPTGVRPIPRGGQGAAWDDEAQQMLVFAGGESLNDLWSFRPATSTWARLTPSVTFLPALAGARAAWDPSRHQTLLFGGETGAATPAAVGIVRVFRAASNSWEEVPTSGGPQVRTGHSVVWDEDGSQALLFGGRKEGDTSGAVLGELWSYAPATNRWTRLSEGSGGPVARAFHSAAFDPKNRQMLVMGGQNDRGTSLEDLWSYSLTTNGWTQLSVTGPAPRARIRHSAVWDTSAGEMLVFGGYRDQEGYTSEVWSFKPEERRWTQRPQPGMAPPGRSRHSAAWDPTSGRMLIFGGYVGGVDYLGDLWAYDASRNVWTQLTSPALAPLARADHVAVWDATAREMLVYGGGAGDPSNELWSYRPVAASPAMSAPAPSGSPPAAPAQSPTGATPATDRR